MPTKYTIFNETTQQYMGLENGTCIQVLESSTKADALAAKDLIRQYGIKHINESFYSIHEVSK